MRRTSLLIEFMRMPLVLLTYPIRLNVIIFDGESFAETSQNADFIIGKLRSSLSLLNSYGKRENNKWEEVNRW